MISEDILRQGLTFKEYYQFSEELIDKKITTGNDQSEQLIEFTKLNFFRTKRILKSIQIPNDYSTTLKHIDTDWTWVLLTEPWCGDAANTVPLIAMLSTLNTRIDLKIFLRDEHPTLMDQFLTNGTRSIPKLICYNKDFVNLGTWGPRPGELENYVTNLKATSTLSSDELKKQIQLWYHNNKGQSFLNEFAVAIMEWKEAEVSAG